MSERMFREVYLPPYNAAVRAGAMTVMTSFNELMAYLPLAINGCWMKYCEKKMGSRDLS